MRPRDDNRVTTIDHHREHLRYSPPIIPRPSNNNNNNRAGMLCSFLKRNRGRWGRPNFKLLLWRTPPLANRATAMYVRSSSGSDVLESTSRGQRIEPVLLRREVGTSSTDASRLLPSTAKPRPARPTPITPVALVLFALLWWVVRSLTKCRIFISGSTYIEHSDRARMLTFSWGAWSRATP